MFTSTSPHWKLNGAIIALDGVMHKQYYYNETETILRISFSRQEFSAFHFIYTCFFYLYNGTVVESNPEEVQISVNCENSIHANDY